MRLRFKTKVTVSSSDAEENDLGNAESDIIVDALNDGGMMRFRVPAGAVNLNVQHGQVTTAKFLFLRSQARDPNDTPVELTMRRNSTGGEAWPLTPADGKEAVWLGATSGLTALYISNPGTIDMVLDVGMCGD